MFAIITNYQFKMKKPVFLTLLFLTFWTGAGAQVFNHLSIGAGTGLDGTSFEVASNLGNHVQLRVGYGTAFGAGYTLKNSNGIELPVHPGTDDGEWVNVPLKLSFARNDARILFNIYPGKRAGFHFTFGAYLGSGSFFRGKLMDLPADYESAGLDMGNQTVQVVNRSVRADLRAFGIGSPTFAVRPYAGIGFGRPVREDKRVTFSFDLGAAYQGAPSLWARSVKGGYVDVSNNKYADITSLVKDYGEYLNFWPTINFHLYVRLF